MQIRCSECGTVYNFPDDRITDNGTPVKCKVCEHVFVVYPEHSAKVGIVKDETETTEEQPVSTGNLETKESSKQPPETIEKSSVAESSAPEEEPDTSPLFSDTVTTGPDDDELIDIHDLHPAKTWAKYALGFIISIGIIALSYYLFDYTRQAMDIWDKVDAQITNSEHLEEKLDELNYANSAWDHYYVAENAMQLATPEGYNQAREKLEKALEINDEFSQAHALLAEALTHLYIANQDPALLEQAVKEAQISAELTPELNAASQAMALINLAKGELTSAQAILDMLLKENPNNGKLHLLQARIYLKTNKSANAVESLRSAISNDALLLDAQFLLAQMYANKRDWDNAIKHAQRAQAINPQHEEVDKYLDIYMAQRDRKLLTSEEKAQNRAQLGPPVSPPSGPIQQRKTFEGLMQEGKRLQRQGSYWDAIGRFSKAVEMQPGRCDARSSLGFAYYDLNRPDVSLNEFKSALSSSPNCAQAHLGMATIYQDKGDKTQAIEHFERFLQIKPSGPEATEVRAILRGLRSR